MSERIVYHGLEKKVNNKFGTFVKGEGQEVAQEVAEVLLKDETEFKRDEPKKEVKK